MRLTWRYFDFDAHWAEFWAAWSTPEVQSILKYDMDTWCATHAPSSIKADGSRPTWTEGQPLWHLSRTDYWSTKIQDAAAEDLQRADACAKKTLSAQGLDLNEYRKRQWGPNDRERPRPKTIQDPRPRLRSLAPKPTNPSGHCRGLYPGHVRPPGQVCVFFQNYFLV